MSKINKRNYNARFNYLQVVSGIVFVFLIIYIAHLQLTNNSTYKAEVQTNTIKQRKIPALRGNIFDRNGVLLASSYYTYDLYIIPHYYHDKPELVCDSLPINCSTFSRNIKQHDLNRFLIVKNISKELAAEFEGISGLYVEKKAQRQYYNETATSHIIGYVGKVGQSVIETDNEDELYANDDVIGKSGIEKVYDRELHGMNGKEEYVVRASGLELLPNNKYLSGNGVVQAVSGNDVVLNIDSSIQELFAREIGFRNGAAVMLDINTGAVLSLYSSPAFDPSHISLVSKDHELINKALSGYAPGSVFKIIMGLAALESGIIDEHHREVCRGYLDAGGREWKCWKHGALGSHGIIDFHDAIKSSCDVYWYEIGLKLGLGQINKYARMLGIGEVSGIDTTGEQKGNMPKTSTKIGEILNTSIGQGEVLITPLQLALSYSTILNGGKLLQPQIVMNSDEPIVKRDNHFSKHTIEVLKSAMYDVLNAPGGTAYNARIPDVIAGGKSGSIQRQALVKKGGLTDNAAFVGYWPVDKPQIVVAVYVEGAIHGSLVAPIVLKAMKRYDEEQTPACY